jgi:tRNA threonylcarbamoyl adenosine modification protein (Sua5/YciO/YrdC/YwlC family)
MHPFTVIEAVIALNAGKLVGVPTDTVYGVAADPWSESGMNALFDLKGRGPEHPVALLVADLEQAHELVDITAIAERLAAEFWPGPLTLVVPAARDLPPWIGDQARGTVGVRVPQHPVALDLLDKAGTLAVTSANRSGEEAAVDHEQAVQIFGNEVIGYLEGAGSAGLASTVLDATVDPPAVLRAGPVAWPREDGDEG